MNGGRYKYVLTTGYRQKTESEAWINSGNANHYDLEELRIHDDGRDTGKWSAKFSPGSMRSRYSTRGNVKEPIPMFMANDYHAWGTRDLGYQIKFKVGETDNQDAHENAFGSKRILLQTKRVVRRHTPTYTVQMRGQEPMVYKDCFIVESTIAFAGLEDKRSKNKKKK